VTVLFGAEIPVTVAVKTRVSDVPMVAVEGETETRIPESIVTVALAVADCTALETAVTVTVLGVGTAEGAVYKPVVLIVPWVESPPVTLLTCQMTDTSVGPVTVARNCCDAPTETVAEGRFKVTVAAAVVPVVLWQPEITIAKAASHPIQIVLRIIPMPPIPIAFIFANSFFVSALQALTFRKSCSR
jgi:hypothetical protein